MYEATTVLGIASVSGGSADVSGVYSMSFIVEASGVYIVGPFVEAMVDLIACL